MQTAAPSRFAATASRALVRHELRLPTSVLTEQFPPASVTSDIAAE